MQVEMECRPSPIDSLFCIWHFSSSSPCQHQLFGYSTLCSNQNTCRGCSASQTDATYPVAFDNLPCWPRSLMSWPSSWLQKHGDGPSISKALLVAGSIHNTQLGLHQFAEAKSGSSQSGIDRNCTDLTSSRSLARWKQMGVSWVIGQQPPVIIHFFLGFSIRNKPSSQSSRVSPWLWKPPWLWPNFLRLGPMYNWDLVTCTRWRAHRCCRSPLHCLEEGWSKGCSEHRELCERSTTFYNVLHHSVTFYKIL